MSNEGEVLPKFRPERPVHLSTENTGFKTQAEVILAVEKLRRKGWLCRADDSIRPLAHCFNIEAEFQEFKKCASDLGVTLKSPIIHADDIADFDAKTTKGLIIPGAEDHETVDDPSGKRHTVRK